MCKANDFLSLLSALVLLGGCADETRNASAAKPTDTTQLAVSNYVRGEMPGIASDVNVYLLADELSDRYIDYESFRLRKPLPFSSESLNCDPGLILDVFSAVADYRYDELLVNTNGAKLFFGLPSWECAIVATNNRVETTLLVMFLPELEGVGVVTNQQFIGLVSGTEKIRSSVRNLQEAVYPEYRWSK